MDRKTATKYWRTIADSIDVLIGAGLYALHGLVLVGSGGLIVGLISIQHPFVWGNGYGALSMILQTDWVCADPGSQL